MGLFSKPPREPDVTWEYNHPEKRFIILHDGQAVKTMTRTKFFEHLAPQMGHEKASGIISALIVKHSPPPAIPKKKTTRRRKKAVAPPPELPPVPVAPPTPVGTAMARPFSGPDDEVKKQIRKHLQSAKSFKENAQKISHITLNHKFVDKRGKTMVTSVSRHKRPSHLISKEARERRKGYLEQARKNMKLARGLGYDRKTWVEHIEPALKQLLSEGVTRDEFFELVDFKFDPVATQQIDRWWDEVELDEGFKDAAKAFAKKAAKKTDRFIGRHIDPRGRKFRIQVQALKSVEKLKNRAHDFRRAAGNYDRDVETHRRTKAGMVSGMDNLRPQSKVQIPLRKHDQDPKRDYLDLDAPKAPDKANRVSRSFLKNVQDHKKTAEIDSKLAAASAKSSEARGALNTLDTLIHKRHQITKRMSVELGTKSSKGRLPQFGRAAKAKEKAERGAPTVFSNPIMGYKKKPKPDDPGPARPVFRSQDHKRAWEKTNAGAIKDAAERNAVSKLGFIKKAIYRFGKKIAAKGEAPVKPREETTPASAPAPRKRLSGKEVLAAYAAMNAKK